MSKHYLVIYKVGLHGRIRRETFSCEKFEKFLDYYTREASNVTVFRFEVVDGQLELEV